MDEAHLYAPFCFLKCHRYRRQSPRIFVTPCCEVWVYTNHLKECSADSSSSGSLTQPPPPFCISIATLVPFVLLAPTCIPIPTQTLRGRRTLSRPSRRGCIAHTPELTHSTAHARYFRSPRIHEGQSGQRAGPLAPPTPLFIFILLSVQTVPASCAGPSNTNNPSLPLILSLWEVVGPR